MRKRYLIQERDDPMGLFIDPVMDFIGLMFFIVIFLLIDARPVKPPELRTLPVAVPTCGLHLPFFMTIPVEGGSGRKVFSDPGGSLQRWGLSLDAASGTISGIVRGLPTAQAERVQIDVHDERKAHALAEFELKCLACGTYRVPASTGQCALVPAEPRDADVAISRSAARLPPARVGAAYEEAIGVRGWFGRLRAAQTGLPAGLELRDGVIRGIPQRAGAFEIETSTAFQPYAAATGDDGPRWPQGSRAGFKLDVLPELIITQTLPVARVGELFTARLFDSPLRYGENVEAQGLPMGMSSGRDGTLSGRPSVAGHFGISVKVVAAERMLVEGTLTLEVLPRAPTPALSDLSLYARVGEALEVEVPYRGMVEPISIQSDALPPGLRLHGLAIVGKPERLGREKVALRVVDALGVERRSMLLLDVIPAPAPLAIVAPRELHVVASSPFSLPVAAIGGSGNVNLKLSELPPGLTFEPGSRSLAGSVGEGAWQLDLRANDENSETRANLIIRSDHAQTEQIRVLNDSLPLAVVGEEYRVSLAAAGMVGAVDWIFAGALPNWLDHAGGVLSGVPAAEGVDTLNVAVRDSQGRMSNPRQLALQSIDVDRSVPGVLTRALPDGVEGQPYRIWLSAAGGFGSYTWSAVDVPPWLTVHESGGLLEGVPPRGAEGGASIRVRVRDARGAFADSPALALRIANVPSPASPEGLARDSENQKRSAEEGWWRAAAFGSGSVLGACFGAIIMTIIVRRRGAT